MKRRQLDGLIMRWKKTSRALKIHEQPYGRYLAGILEERTDAELALFEDPLEAAAFFCLLDLVERTAPSLPPVTAEPCRDRSLAGWQTS